MRLNAAARAACRDRTLPAMTIRYLDTLDDLTTGHLAPGFFTGWPNPPAPETHFAILRGSRHIWLAQDEANGQIVGFVNALTDGVLCAFIPLLEVVPPYQQQGIGRALMTRMLETLSSLYSIDIVCDAALQPFYARFGMQPYSAMLKRNYDAQAGRPT
jgi:GNAT superfamily N-acetyltransferase